MAPDTTRAFMLIDEAHSRDPNRVEVEGNSVPYELHYAERMTIWLHKHTTSPSPLLSTAVRAQHFRRWEIPRSSYPEGKTGYFAWRSFLKKRQAEQVRDICLECCYTTEQADRVAALIAKEDLKRGEGKGDWETQILEDVACLVFLDDQFDDFEKHHNEEKIINILKKTWTKMGKRGQALALQMELSPRAKELIETALTDVAM